MAIEVKKRPYVYNLSGNTIYYQLYSAAATSDPAIFFQVRVKFAHPGDEYVEITTLDLYPTAGFAGINIQDVLDSKLEYEQPALTDDLTEITTAYKQSGYFFIEFREITSEQSDSTWDSSEFDYICGVMKGGLSYFKFRNNNYWINYWKAGNLYKFLTWQQNGRLANINERMYLAFLNGFGTGTNDLQVLATVYYTDNSTDSATHTYAAQPNGVVAYIPAGCTHWGLGALNPDKKIKYWTIEIRVAAAAYSEVFRFTADNRKYYNDFTLHYRNSLGGLDSMRVRGLVDHNLSYDNQKQDRVFEPDYYNNQTISPQQTIANNKELKSWKGDVGYLSKEEQDRLRDAHLQRQVYWERNGKWWPVNIITGNIKQKGSGDQVWSFPIEWTLAHSGDHYYTPENVDIGDGVFTDNVCQAFPSDFDIDVDITDPVNAVITINLTENDPQAASTQFSLKIVGIDEQTYSYDSLPIVRTIPKGTIYTFEFRSICTGGIIGKKVTTEVDTTEAPPPPPPPDSNSLIINNTSTPTAFIVDINSNTFAAANVGANISKKLGVADDNPDAQIVVTISNFRPASIRIISNVVVYTGTVVNSGSGIIATFNHVNITAGFNIALS